MTILFDVEHLKSLVAIVDSGFFTRAVESVHKTQSAISMQMRRLEEWPFHILYASWSSTAVGAAVLAGLAVLVLPESAIKAGMRILGGEDLIICLPASFNVGIRRYS